MEEGAKRRLAGAAVVVVLLVIFLPMLLEEEIPSPVPERDMSIPPRPDFDQGFDASVSDGPVEPSVSTFPEYEDPIPGDPPMPQELEPPILIEAPAAAEEEAEGEGATDPAIEFEIIPEPAPDLVEEMPPRVEQPPAAEEAPPPEAAPAPTSAPTPATAKLTSWVLQVASLRERARAYSLVQDLRTKGFPAYMEEAQVKDQLWHRVRIGPEAERKQIESLAASLKAKTGMNGQIRRYP